MHTDISPAQIALTTVALAWPLAAGLGLVLWSKLRAHSEPARAASIDADLRAMYRSLEMRGIPSRLALVIQALDEDEAMHAASPKRRRRRASLPQI